MAAGKKSLLRETVRTAAGIVLLLASCIEIAGVLTEYGAGTNGRLHLFFAVVSVAGSLFIFSNVGYSAYAVLPLALGMFFYEIYQTASTTLSVYTIASGLCFFVTAVLCFMLIRAHKI
jgi:hypothetical protein